MKREVTLYELLEVDPHASDLVIKAAYRCLAQAHHPDKHSGKAVSSERLAAINSAFSVLSDPVKRRRYDEATALAERFVERRGGDMPPRHNHPETKIQEPRGMRAFVFRPFT